MPYWYHGQVHLRKVKFKNKSLNGICKLPCQLMLTTVFSHLSFCLYVSCKICVSYHPWYTERPKGIKRELDPRCKIFCVLERAMLGTPYFLKHSKCPWLVLLQITTQTFNSHLFCQNEGKQLRPAVSLTSTDLEIIVKTNVTPFVSVHRTEGR